MKTKVASLLVVLLIATTQLSAQQKITVEAQNDDISYNLDLKAVASIFGDSKDLEEFEMKLNDYDSQISNLDLNNDGEVDYLRVIETTEKNINVVVIQAVLDRDVFQDVATIVVDRSISNRTVVQVIGDPYMYGNNYIIEPIYYRTPLIYSYFWGRNYRTWNSPYYWGYYPSYYHNRRPFAINIYLSNIHTHINSRYDYRYSNTWRNDNSYRLHNSISRNDYYKVHPDRTFSKRNDKVVNKYDFEKNNKTESARRTTSSYNNNSSGSRNQSSSRNTSPTWSGGQTIQRSSSATNGSRSNDVRRTSNTTTTVTRPVQTDSRRNNSSQNTVTTNSSRTNTYTTPSSNTKSVDSRKTTPTVVNRPVPTVRSSSTPKVTTKTATPSRATESTPATEKTTKSSTSTNRR
ncbi:MAG: hypothetical protein PHS59_06865 [Paludibacter sp.]|nr:hypothetical protein [Paludibacter sp.]